MIKMNDKQKEELKQFILNQVGLEELEGMFAFLLDEFKEQLGYNLSYIALAIASTVHKDLEADFRLLSKNCSENFTLNKEHSQKELEETRKEGAGYYENKTMKNIFLAASRFGKENFPEYMPQTKKYLPKKTTRKDIQNASEEKKILLLNANSGV